MRQSPARRHGCVQRDHELRNPDDGAHGRRPRRPPSCCGETVVSSFGALRPGEEFTSSAALGPHTRYRLQVEILIPEWLGEAVAAALAGALGFFGKWFIDHLRTRRSLRHSELDELRRLRAMLQESGSIFRSQNYQARRLMALLRGRLGDEVPKGVGFDEAFYRLFDQMVDEERELHSLIRATTMNSMRRLNGEFRTWLARNMGFRQNTASPTSRALAKQLGLLELHMNQWHDKYAAVIPNDEKRSLVYLADEKKHGVGFPKELDDAVESAIREYEG